MRPFLSTISSRRCIRVYPKADLFHVKNIEGFYNSLLYEQMAHEVAQGGGIGLANLLLNKFKMNILEKRDDSKGKD